MALACLLTGDSLSLILTPLAQSAGSSVAEMDIDAVVDLPLSVVLVLLLLRGGIARCVRRDVYVVFAATSSRLCPATGRSRLSRSCPGD